MSYTKQQFLEDLTKVKGEYAEEVEREIEKASLLEEIVGDTIKEKEQRRIINKELRKRSIKGTIYGGLIGLVYAIPICIYIAEHYGSDIWEQSTYYPTILGMVIPSLGQILVCTN